MATVIECTHRAARGIALLLVIGLVWWSRREFPKGHRARKAASWSLSFICIEALIGAGLVTILLVGMTGAIAALGDTLFPTKTVVEGFRADADPAAHFLVRLRVLHPVLAILVGISLSVMVWAVGIGLANRFLLAPTAVQLTHLLVADLLWVATVIFAAGAKTRRREDAIAGS